MRIMKKWPKCSKDFWQALSEFYFDNGDLEKNNVVHPRVLIVLISLVIAKTSYSTFVTS